MSGSRPTHDREKQQGGSGRNARKSARQRTPGPETLGARCRPGAHYSSFSTSLMDAELMQ
jgi:hypothetical protein